jgi:DNA-binding MarR family transcriptional regulator
MINRADINLTELEFDVLNAIATSEFSVSKPTIINLPYTWSNAVIDKCQQVKKDQLSGVVASLSKKGFVNQKENFESNNDTITEVTVEGFMAYTAFLSFLPKQELACSACGSKNVKKDGKTASGEQKVLCKDCGKRGKVISEVTQPENRADKEEGTKMPEEKKIIKKTVKDATETPAVDETGADETGADETQTPVADPVEAAPAAKKVPAKKAAAAPKAPHGPREKKVNDIYARGLYTVTRMMNESGFAVGSKELKKFCFGCHKALKDGVIKHEVEQLQGRQWRRIIKAADAIAYMKSVLPDFQAA